MQITLGPQYNNVGEKPTVILYIYINRHAGTMLFRVLFANPKKLLYTVVANPARGLLNEQGKENKRKSLAAYPVTPPPTLLVRRKMEVNGSHQSHQSSWFTTTRCSDQQGSKSRQSPCQVQPTENIGNLSASRGCLKV